MRYRWGKCRAGEDLLGGEVMVLVTVLVTVEGEAVTVTVETGFV